MGILYYLIGCIPICVLGFILYNFVDRINLMEKIKNFDKANSGPVYCFFRNIIFILVIASFGLIMFPIIIYQDFIDGYIFRGLLMSLLCAIAITLDIIVFDEIQQNF